MPHNARMTAPKIEPPRAKLAADHLADRLAVIVAGPMTPPRHPQTTPLVSCVTQTTQTTTPELGPTGAVTLEQAGISHR
jgi:hypothetical protein